MPASGQMTIRTSADLVLRVKAAAAAEGKSMNEFVEHLIEVAVDPSHATTEDERLVARLRAAGIYSEPSEWTPVEPPDPKLLAEAREAFRGGRPASEYVRIDRDE
jgi:hypothetical protein